MVDISVVSDDLTLNRWSADSLWRSRRRRGLGGRRRGWGLFALDNASADSLTLFNSGRRRGGRRGRLLGSFDISHNARRRRGSLWWLRRLPNTLTLNDSSAGTLMLVFVRARRGDTARSPDDPLLSNTGNWAGASRSMSVNGLNLTLAENHGTSFGSAAILPQKGGCARLLPSGRANGDCATTIVDFIEALWGRAARSWVVVPLLKVGGPDAGHFGKGYVV